ncbi:MAG: hypothetical protein F6K32_14800 [Desertifilum sp. SIO1I2]|nr:hypothetical protein [Desertifilum sp. SIO1I2]
MMNQPDRSLDNNPSNSSALDIEDSKPIDNEQSNSQAESSPTPTASALEEDINFNDFAGFNPNIPLTLEAQYQLAQDEETPQPPPIAERGIPRLVTMLLLTGGAILLGLIIWQLIKPRSAIKPIAQTTSQETQEYPIEDEKPELLARLAYQDQQQLIAKEPKNNEQPQIESNSLPTPKAAPLPERTVERPAPPPVAAPPVTPPPAPIVRTVTAPAPTPQPTPTPVPEKVDPFERWNQLAQLGQTRGNVDIEESLVAQNAPVPTSDDALSSTSSPEQLSIPNNDSTQEDFGDRLLSAQNSSPSLPRDNREDSSSSHLQPTPDELSPELLTVNIGQEQPQEQRLVSSHLSSGARGILSRTPQPLTTLETLQVALGITAPGTVSVPLLWDEGSGEQLYNRFAITLTEDLSATNGSSNDNRSFRKGY